MAHIKKKTCEVMCLEPDLIGLKYLFYITPFFINTKKKKKTRYNLWRSTNVRGYTCRVSEKAYDDSTSYTKVIRASLFSLLRTGSDKTSTLH